MKIINFLPMFNEPAFHYLLLKHFIKKKKKIPEVYEMSKFLMLFFKTKKEWVEATNPNF